MTAEELESFLYLTEVQVREDDGSFSWTENIYHYDVDIDKEDRMLSFLYGPDRYLYSVEELNKKLLDPTNYFFFVSDIITIKIAKIDNKKFATLTIYDTNSLKRFPEILRTIKKYEIEQL